MSVLEQRRCIWMRLNTSAEPMCWPPEVTVESRLKCLGGAHSSVPSLDQMCLPWFTLMLRPALSAQNPLRYWSWGLPAQAAGGYISMAVFAFAMPQKAAQLGCPITSKSHRSALICHSSKWSPANSLEEKKIQLGTYHPTLPNPVLFSFGRFLTQWNLEVGNALGYQ